MSVDHLIKQWILHHWFSLFSVHKGIPDMVYHWNDRSGTSQLLNSLTYLSSIQRRCLTAMIPYSVLRILTEQHRLGTNNNPGILRSETDWSCHNMPEAGRNRPDSDPLLAHCGMFSGNRGHQCLASVSHSPSRHSHLPNTSCKPPTILLPSGFRPRWPIATCSY